MAVRVSRLASSFRSETNALYRERDQRLAHGLPIVDLASGNVTEHGISFPRDLLRAALADASGTVQAYRPDPLGQPAARDAISAYYRSQGLEVPADRIVLTPGTSLAYWYAFSVLCDPGDEVLTPRPSYPLFDELARLAHVRVTTYGLDEHRNWAIDVDEIAGAITDRTRAIILVSPHNPTGAVAAADELVVVAAIAGERGLPIIADEVFGEFLFGGDALPRPAATKAPLVITLNGFSKLFVLPAIKLGWMALTGGTDAVEKTLAALERISDAFLPVNELVQAAVPRILSDGRVFVEEYRQEMAERRRACLDILGASARVSVIPPRGGFYLAVRVKTDLDDDALALHILRKTGCLVHPGHFYDLDPTHLVFSFVSASETGRESLRRVVAAIDAAP